jgi:hypothetical protein
MLVEYQPFTPSSRALSPGAMIVGDRDLRVLQVLPVLQAGRDLRRGLGLRQAAHLDLADQRHRDTAALVDARFGRQVRLLVHGDADRVADAELLRLRPSACGERQKEDAAESACCNALHHVSCLS